MDDNTQTDNTEYAGFGLRVFATIIDFAWQIVIFGGLGYLIFGDAFVEALKAENPFTVDLSLLLYQNLLPALIVIAFWIFYGATPAKMLLGLKIVRASDGGKMGIGRSIVRFLAYIPVLLTLGIGFLWTAFDKRKQSLHDKIAGTVVIKTER